MFNKDDLLKIAEQSLENYAKGNKGKIKDLLYDVAGPTFQANKDYLKNYIIDPYGPNRKKRTSVKNFRDVLEAIYGLDKYDFFRRTKRQTLFDVNSRATAHERYSPPTQQKITEHCAFSSNFHRVPYLVINFILILI